MEIGEAYECVSSSFKADPGRFYEPGTRLALGKGCIYRAAAYAVFDPAQGRYRTAEGSVYVLTHECDVDETNDRLFNSDVLVCPLLSLEEVVAEQSEATTEERLQSFLTNLGARLVSRVAYLPPIPNLHAYGSVMCLNMITNAPVDLLKARAERVCALSSFGLRDIEYILENHLLRPKNEALAFAAPPAAEPEPLQGAAAAS